MATKINPDWQNHLRLMIHTTNEIDEVISFNPATQWLISQLAIAGKPFKVYNLGAGVKRVTTKTDTCPCCKRKL